MILIKLGGSIITNKGKPQSARRKTIYNILKQIKNIYEPMILVHGGGSYGHYWSVKYGMHTKPARYSLKGLSIVKNSMIELDKIILNSAAKNRLNTYSLPPTDFMNGNQPIRNKIQKIGEIAKSGLTPVTYGDALWYGQKKSYILFGVVYSGSGTQPITVALNNLVNTSVGGKEYNVDMAAAIIAALPTLVVYVIAGKYFIRGLTAGAVKG